MSGNDTIAALATAPGEAGIAIVRISGPETYAIADAIFRGRGEPPSRRKPFTFAHGRIVDAEGHSMDDALMLFMRGPRSYTGEDQVEVHGHGGSISSRRILRRVIEAGARLAEPGEFTRRAFLNGRMDLVQAEAVLDLIKARSERAAKAAVDQLKGTISSSLSSIYDDTIALNADLEATMDFPEDELPEAVMEEILGRLEVVRRRTSALLETWSEGRMLREGALVVIAGQPNVGKSTLMNALLGQSRAIVSDTPGTTRDTIEEGYVLNGIPLRLVDTAGLRDTACDIEREGIRRSRDHLQKADLTIYLLDATQGVTPEDEDNLKKLDPAKTLVVWNKMDLVAGGMGVQGSGFGVRGSEFGVRGGRLGGMEGDLDAIPGGDVEGFRSSEFGVREEDGGRGSGFSVRDGRAEGDIDVVSSPQIPNSPDGDIEAISTRPPNPEPRTPAGSTPASTQSQMNASYSQPPPPEPRTPNPHPRRSTELRLSLKDTTSVSLIREALGGLLDTGYRQGAEQQAVISERHRAILADFKRQVETAAELAGTRREDQIPLASAHLRDGLEALGTATGRVYHQELLNAIFSRFCIGK
jgi:tRNA modification GTPase